MSSLHRANDNCLRILVTTRPLGKTGGVSVLFRVLYSHLAQKITYFTVGYPAERRPARCGAQAMIARSRFGMKQAILLDAEAAKFWL